MASSGSAFWRWNDRFKRHGHTYMVVLAVLIGVLGGLGAVGFRSLIEFFEVLIWQGDGLNMAWIAQLPWYWIVFAPAAGGLVVGMLVHYGAPEAKGHGVPEVMEAVALKGGRIRPRVVAIKSLASSICLASGGSVGREGPIVQIGAALASTMGQWLRMGVRRMRTLAGCGAAAGIAATFNAPIAGALFAMEVLLKDLRVSEFTPIVVSAVIATAVGREMLGDELAFSVPAYALESPWELGAYIVLGLLAGVMGVIFIRALYGAEDLVDRLKWWPPLITAIGGAAVGGIAVFFPDVLGNGYEAIEQALAGQEVWRWFVLLGLAKMAAVCLTIGSGGSGGIFAPSLFMGAMIGGLVGVLMNSVFPGSVGPVGAYALVGMGSVVAATTHAPLTAILILFELTSDYRIILPLMIACTLATLISSWKQGDSIYTLKLTRRGVNLQRGRDVDVLKAIRADTIMRSEYGVLPAGEPLLDLLSDIAHDAEPAYFVQDEDGGFVGMLTLHDIRPVLGDIEACKHLVSAGDLADRIGSPLSPDDTLDVALLRMQEAHRAVWPIADDTGLKGCVHLEDILTCYRGEIFKRDMAQGMSDAFSTDERVFRAVGSFVVAEKDAPGHFDGQTLASLDLRGRHGVTVLVIKREVDGSEEVLVPNAETVIRCGDRLLVLGTEAGIEGAIL